MNFEQFILVDIRNLLREILEVAKTLKSNVPPVAPAPTGGPIDADNPEGYGKVFRPVNDQSAAKVKTIKNKVGK